MTLKKSVETCFTVDLPLKTPILAQKKLRKISIFGELWNLPPDLIWVTMEMGPNNIPAHSIRGSRPKFVNARYQTRSLNSRKHHKYLKNSKIITK